MLRVTVCPGEGGGPARTGPARPGPDRPACRRQLLNTQDGRTDGRTGGPRCRCSGGLFTPWGPPLQEESCTDVQHKDEPTTETLMNNHSSWSWPLFLHRRSSITSLKQTWDGVIVTIKVNLFIEYYLTKQALCLLSQCRPIIAFHPNIHRNWFIHQGFHILFIEFLCEIEFIHQRLHKSIFIIIIISVCLSVCLLNVFLYIFGWKLISLNNISYMYGSI